MPVVNMMRRVSPITSMTPSSSCIPRIFSLPAERRRYGELTPCDPSRFLQELPEQDLVWVGGKSEAAKQENRERGAQHLAGLKSVLG